MHYHSIRDIRIITFSFAFLYVVIHALPLHLSYLHVLCFRNILFILSALLRHEQYMLDTFLHLE